MPTETMDRFLRALEENDRFTQTVWADLSGETSECLLGHVFARYVDIQPLTRRQRIVRAVRRWFRR
jgi:hypothetical protein